MQKQPFSGRLSVYSCRLDWLPLTKNPTQLFQAYRGLFRAFAADPQSYFFTIHSL